MPQKKSEEDVKKELQEEIQNLQTALEQSQNEVGDLKDLIEEKNKEINQRKRKRQTRSTSFSAAINSLTVAQAALEEITIKNEDLEKKVQEQPDKPQLQEETLEEKYDRLMTELFGDFQKLLQELSDREETFNIHLSAQDKVFKMTLQDLWKRMNTKAGEWAERRRQLREMLSNKEKEEEALQVSLLFLTNVRRITFQNEIEPKCSFF